jgi:glucosamine-phosphate N-acetyltransferase
MTTNIEELDVFDYKEYLILLNNYKTVKTNMNYIEFDKLYNNIKQNSKIFIYKKNNKIVATITVIIEQKFIHNNGKVGHFEDVFVSSEYRNLGIGKQLIEYAKMYCKLEKCYKIILNCSADLITYYKLFDFSDFSVQMRYDFEFY